MQPWMEPWRREANRSAAAADRAEEFRLLLDYLEWHWGEAYDIRVNADGWSARRRDGLGEPLRAGSPAELKDLILADYTAMPVPREDVP